MWKGNNNECRNCNILILDLHAFISICPYQLGKSGTSLDPVVNIPDAQEFVWVSFNASAEFIAYNPDWLE
jgi:hypothetical protein